MRINIHAGHNPDNKIGSGAVGLIKESTEARRVKDQVMSLLKIKGHTVFDCTVNDGKNQSDVLSKIVKKCNANKVDLDVSIHFNSGRNDYKGNGSVGGTEVFIYSTTSGALVPAQRIVRNISKLGYPIRDDRIKDDVKTSTSLYVLKNTKSPAVLVECCFVDDADDVSRYDLNKMANAIANGIMGKNVVDMTTPVTYVKDTRKSDAEIAAEVKAGKWGNGADRRERLTAAGYNYDTIQSIVNGKKATPQILPVKLYYPKYNGKSGSIVTALNSLKINSSLANRKNIAKKNGINLYTGTAEQNTRLLSLLKAGKLVSL